MILFSERLRKLIKNNNYKYLDIEQATGIKTYTISNYVNGTTEPDIDAIIKLSLFFKVSSDYLIGYSDKPYPKYIETAFEELEEIFHKDFDIFKSTVEKILMENKTTR